MSAGDSFLPPREASDNAFDLALVRRLRRDGYGGGGIERANCLPRLWSLLRVLLNLPEANKDGCTCIPDGTKDTASPCSARDKGTDRSNPARSSGESRTNRPAARHGSAFCPAECRHLAANISFERACSRSTRICWYAIVQKRGDCDATLAQFVTWIVMGLVGGSLVGLIITRERRGFGLARNMGLGLAGAI